MLEQTPHNSVHSTVGGNMGSLASAALDPVFWLHHSNIDRLWSVWLGMQGAHHQNPDPRGSWGTTASRFHSPNGTPVSGTGAGVLDTVADLGYEYEDTNAPPPLTARLSRLVPSQPPPEHPAELIGATEAPVELRGGTESVSLALGRPQAPPRAAQPRAPSTST